MKLQYLAVIFIIIILPIILVLSQYVDYHIDAINLRHTYNTKLINATYDAIKSYQLNTVNNAISDIPASKIDELEASVNTFFNSITTNYGYEGYNAKDMKDYIPAVVFTLYDGYYIYSPFNNVLTGVDTGDASNPNVDPSYTQSYNQDGKLLYGIKPYVYYSCRYSGKSDGKDFDVVITYTLDNFITVQGTIDNNYVNKSGYLIDGIEKNGSKYIYEGITFSENTTEELQEYLGENLYSYAKIKGTKYYLENGSSKDNGTVFYINHSGEKTIQTSSKLNNSIYKEYYDMITKNNSAYQYYKDAYIFTRWIRSNLGELNTNNAIDVDTSEFNGSVVFGKDKETNKTGTGNGYIQEYDSIFNMHRSEIIRYTVTKNLSSAIAGYKSKLNPTEEFIMPKISDTDWNLIENNVSIITFLQGFKIGGRDYNKYCVLANNLNKEYIDENDIYILGKDNIYYRVDDATLDIDNSQTKIDSTSNAVFYRGIWKLNFESRAYKKELVDGNYEDTSYFPISYKNGSSITPYIGSYSSIIASTSVNNEYQDMYKYMREERNGNDNNSIAIKTVYYTALARERWNPYYKVDASEEPQEPETPDEQPTTQKGKIKIVKTDEDNNPIAGAWFWIYKGQKEDENNKVGEYPTGNDGIITVELDYGTYYVVEKYVLDKYEMDGERIITLSKEEETLNFVNKIRSEETDNKGAVPEIFNSSNGVIMLDVSNSMNRTVRSILWAMYNNSDKLKNKKIYLFGTGYKELSLDELKNKGVEKYIREELTENFRSTTIIQGCWYQAINSGEKDIILISDLQIGAAGLEKGDGSQRVEVYQIRPNGYVDWLHEHNLNEFKNSLEHSGISKDIVKDRKIHAIYEKDWSREDIDF